MFPPDIDWPRQQRTESEETPLTMTRDRRATRNEARYDWQPTPAGSTLIAWGGHRDAEGIVQARLYRTWDGRYLVYEQQHDATAASTVHARVTCRELDEELARTVYAGLGVHPVSEALAFDA